MGSQFTDLDERWERIWSEQFSQNGALGRIINKFPNPPNKDVGEGLNTALEAMRKLQLKEPKIEQQENAVIVYIRHEPLATADEIVLDYLETHSLINNSKGRELCHIGSENVMKSAFERLMQRSLIERVADRRERAAAYRRTDKLRDLAATTDLNTKQTLQNRTLHLLYLYGLSPTLTSRISDFIPATRGEDCPAWAHRPRARPPTGRPPHW